MSNTTISLDYRTQNPMGNLAITGSKSESNRWLILQKLLGNIEIHNLSEAEDTCLMQQALNSPLKIIDIHHAGTAMRFLTAYFAASDGKDIVLTGSDRMKNRPISLLVAALKNLGADIEYLEKDGYPPLNIKGKKIIKNKVSIAGNISSQYISALLLIAPTLPNGLTIEFTTEITSKPYLEMTISQLKELGVSVLWNENKITVKSFLLENENQLEVTIESDWSSASYFYSLVALSNNGEVSLSSYYENSKQGDAVLSKLYELFGVKTIFKNHEIQLKKDADFKSPTHIALNLIETPDIAQTIAVTCLGMGINCQLTGLQTLKIKETDRLFALKKELEKFGAQVLITDDSLQLTSPKQLNENVTIETYHDHRMAMAFAPLSLKTPINIEDRNVVEKSHPKFWDDINQLLT